MVGLSPCSCCWSAVQMRLAALGSLSSIATCTPQAFNTYLPVLSWCGFHYESGDFLVSGKQCWLLSHGFENVERVLNVACFGQVHMPGGGGPEKLHHFNEFWNRPGEGN